MSKRGLIKRPCGCLVRPLSPALGPHGLLVYVVADNSACEARYGPGEAVYVPAVWEDDDYLPGGYVRGVEGCRRHPISHAFYDIDI